MIYKYILYFLFITSLWAYIPSISQQLVYMSKISSLNKNSINAWNCDVCSKYKIVNPKVFFNIIGDLQGFTGYSKILKSIIVSFRGTSNIQNWIIDFQILMIPYLNCKNCKVHSGFYKGWMLVKSLVESQIKQLRKIYVNAPIYITGHSLGAALACMSALDIQSVFKNVAGIYAFAQPRVGNSYFAAIMNTFKQYYRIIYYADIVPQIPSQLMGFLHGGVQIWYNKSMKIYKACQPESIWCSKSLPLILLNDKDHSMDFYTKMIKIGLSDESKGVQIINQPVLLTQLTGLMTNG